MPKLVSVSPLPNALLYAGIASVAITEEKQYSCEKNLLLKPATHISECHTVLHS